MNKVSSDDKRTEIINQARLLQVKHVLAMWPVSRNWLWKKTVDAGPDRIPSYQLGGKRCYRYDELMFWLDSHKTLPRDRAVKIED